MTGRYCVTVKSRGIVTYAWFISKRNANLFASNVLLRGLTLESILFVQGATYEAVDSPGEP